MAESRDFIPPTPEEVAEAMRQNEELFRILAEARKNPQPHPRMSRFNEPIGLDRNGNLQRPLTDEERAHNEAVRRRARGEQPE